MKQPQSVCVSGLMPTLEQVWNEYVEVRLIKYETVRNYRFNLYSHLSDWLKRPMNSFRKAEVIERHRFLTRAHGRGAANSTMRLFRALFNYAIAVGEDKNGNAILTHNPAMVLKLAQLWNYEPPRTRHLSPAEFPVWWQSVKKLDTTTPQDFLAFCLFTGCRKSEAANLKWANVSLADGFVLFENTKNKKDHKLPICSQLLSLLARRKELYGGYYVFAQATNPLKPYNPKHYTTKKIEEDCGLCISPHDLRRTYATVCSTLRFETLLIKRLLNHSDRDVTDRYIMRNLEPFRKEIQQAGDTIEALLQGQKHASLDFDSSFLFLNVAEEEGIDE